MVKTKVTHGVKVSVQTYFQDTNSNPEQGNYLFSYKITIENKSEYTVQLLKRHWHIFDSSGEYREVRGEGVVGEQPVLEPGEIFEYESVCNLTTDMGAMHGTYLMKRAVDNENFNIHIPEFELIVPTRLN